MLSNPKPRLRLFAVAIIILAATGVVDATYLTIKHYTGGPVPCAITSGCETVTTSSYSVVAGVPVALAGAAYYLVMLVMGIIIVETRSVRWIHRLAWCSLAGLLASAYLVYLQAAVLHAYCIYCLASAATSTILFVVAWWLKRWVKHTQDITLPV